MNLVNVLVVFIVRTKSFKNNNRQNYKYSKRKTKILVSELCKTWKSNDFNRKSFVIEYCGEVLPAQYFEKRSLEYSEMGSKHFYFMSFNEYIDATRKGNISRFLNHSCDPNCFLQKWIIGNRMLIGIFTKKAVKEGEELTFDYQFERYGSKAQICHCGTDKCSGYIGKDKEDVGTRSIDQLDLLSDEEEDELSEHRVFLLIE